MQGSIVRGRWVDERHRRRRRPFAGRKAALVFAEEEARLRGATLRAVHAWQYGYIGYTGFEGGMPASAVTSRSCTPPPKPPSRRACAKRCPIRVEIEQRTIQGAPAGVLVDESRDADLLVVGSRGHGGFARFCWAPSASSALTTPSARS